MVIAFCGVEKVRCDSNNNENT